MRSRLLIGFLLIVALLVVPAVPSHAKGKEITFPFASEDSDDLWWTDTWGAPRSGGRTHEGVDIFAPKMAKLVAVEDVTVVRGRFDNNAAGLSGNYLRVKDDEGWEYLYIHLNNDTPGTDDGNATCTQAFSAKLCSTLNGTSFAAGTRLNAGELVGYNGDSGNAETTPPHIHFEVLKPDSSGNTNEVNPTPYVDAAFIGTKGLVTSYPGEPYGQWSGASQASERINTALKASTSSSSKVKSIQSSVEARGFWNVLESEVAPDSTPAAAVARLYKSFFDRVPDVAGHRYWVSRINSGAELSEVAKAFADSEEFANLYEGASTAEFVDELYNNVLDRAPDSKGKAYWVSKLVSGEIDQASAVLFFSQSEEMVQQYGDEVDAILAYSLFVDRAPSPAEVDGWTNYPVLRASERLKATFG